MKLRRAQTKVPKTKRNEKEEDLQDSFYEYGYSGLKSRTFLERNELS